MSDDVDETMLAMNSVFREFNDTHDESAIRMSRTDARTSCTTILVSRELVSSRSICWALAPPT